MVENQFVAFKLDHGLGIDVGGGSAGLDAGDGAFCVSMRSSENSAIEAGAGFLFTSTPTPSLRNMAAAVSCAHRDTGRIAIMGRQTKYRHLNKSTKIRPTTFRTTLLHSLACGFGRGYWLGVVARDVLRHPRRLRRKRERSGAIRKWGAPRSLGAGEVDESPLHVGANELGAKPVADVESLLTLRQQSLDVRLQNPNKGSASR